MPRESLPAQSLLAQVVGVCCVMAVFALFAVGAAEGEATRRLVQTAPLWFPAVFGLRGAGLVKWAALPILGFWAALAAVAWATQHGHALPVPVEFSPEASAVSLGVGILAAIGMALALAVRSSQRLATGLVVVLAMGALQVAAYLLALNIGVDHHRLVIVD